MLKNKTYTQHDQLIHRASNITQSSTLMGKTLSENTMISMLDTKATTSRIWSIRIFAIILCLIFISSLPFATRMTIVVKPFLPSVLSIMIVSEWITSFLFFGQFFTTRRIAYAFLANAYLYSGLIIVPHLLTFPGIFSQSGWLGATSQTAIWLWVFWHGGFPLGLMIFALADRTGKRTANEKRIWHWIIYSFAITLSIVALETLLAIHYVSYLPTLITGRNYFHLFTSGVGPIVWLINAAAVLSVTYPQKHRRALRMWIAIVAFASWIDVTLTLYASGRYMVGWYVARFTSLIAGLVILLVLLGEIVRLYHQFAIQQVHISYLAYHDPLTGLANRRLFLERLQHYLSTTSESTFFAILALDLDGFKNVNDTYGHEAGDQLLQEIANRLTHSVQPEDVVSRFGGDEFTLLVTSASNDADILHMVDQILNSVLKKVVLQDGEVVSVTASIGIALYPLQAKTAQTLLRCADQALYTAKELGKNQYIFGT